MFWSQERVWPVQPGWAGWRRSDRNDQVRNPHSASYWKEYFMKKKKMYSRQQMDRNYPVTHPYWRIWVETELWWFCCRKANGNLHYFINGLDQGVAASRLPSQAKKKPPHLVNLGYGYISFWLGVGSGGSVWDDGEGDHRWSRRERRAEPDHKVVKIF